MPQISTIFRNELEKRREPTGNLNVKRQKEMGQMLRVAAPEIVLSRKLGHFILRQSFDEIRARVKNKIPLHRRKT